MIKIYRLFLLLSLSSTVCAMKPASIWMREDAPSYFPQATHQCCGSACCALTVFAAAQAFICCNEPSCAMSESGCTLWAKARGTEIILGGYAIYQGWQRGKSLGVITHKLDQRLNVPKEKLE